MLLFKLSILALGILLVSHVPMYTIIWIKATTRAIFDIALPVVRLISQVKEIFNPRYRRRTIYNKGAILILVWSFLTTNLVYFIRYAATTAYSSLVYYIALSIGVLLIPVAGWLADVSYGRYKIVQWSMWTVWISSILLAGDLVVIQLLLRVTKWPLL